MTLSHLTFTPLSHVFSLLHNLAMSPCAWPLAKDSRAWRSFSCFFTRKYCMLLLLRTLTQVRVLHLLPTPLPAGLLLELQFPTELATPPLESFPRFFPVQAIDRHHMMPKPSGNAGELSFFSGDMFWVVDPYSWVFFVRPCFLRLVSLPFPFLPL